MSKREVIRDYKFGKYLIKNVPYVLLDGDEEADKFSLKTTLEISRLFKVMKNSDLLTYDYQVWVNESYIDEVYGDYTIKNIPLYVYHIYDIYDKIISNKHMILIRAAYEVMVEQSIYEMDFNLIKKAVK